MFFATDDDGERWFVSRTGSSVYIRGSKDSIGAVIVDTVIARKIAEGILGVLDAQ